MCQTVVGDVYEQIENVQGGQNREINPERCLPLKPPTQHLTKGGGPRGVVAQAITTVPWEFFLFAVHFCSMPNKKPGVIRVGTRRQNSD